MKLLIKREHIPGGNQGLVHGKPTGEYALTVKVELTEEESELFLRNELLYKGPIDPDWPDDPDFGDDPYCYSVTTYSLLKGNCYRFYDLDDLCSFEEGIKRGCQIIKARIEALKTFDNEDVIEY